MTNHAEEEVATPDASGLMSNEAKVLAAARGRRNSGFSTAVSLVS